MENNMQYYMAPLEGITTYIYRSVYHKYYKGFDKYFTPFLASKRLSVKEANEIKPEHNEGMNLVPQILSNNIETFLEIAKQIADVGYDTININLGCPSGTVVSRKRGAGQLADTYALEKFLDEVFEKCPTKISIKTRVGMYDTCEWEDILAVYAKLPLEELIIHPRLREDYYKGRPRLETVKQALDANLPYPVCYNGDITSQATYDDILKELPGIDSVMVGRGILRNPALIDELSGEGKTDRLQDFMSELADSYEYHYGVGQDSNCLFKLKDVWNHLGLSFPDREKQLKAIRKSDSLSEYRIAVKRFFAQKE